MTSYSEQVRAHILSPHHRGEIADANGIGQEENPVCGDVMTIWVHVEEGVVAAAGFEVAGCEPSIAAGSVATELIIGKSVAEAQSVTRQQIAEALGGLPTIKMHCAVLAAGAIRKALADYEVRHHHQLETQELETMDV
jgi:nitrogen fixation NifU-like protein